MNYCLLNDSFPPAIDGVANVVVNYATILQQRDNQVMVVAPEYPDYKDDFNFQVCRFPSLDTIDQVGYRTGLPFAGDTFSKVSQFHPDLYHVHCPVTTNLLARALRESVPAPLVYTYHTKFDVDIKELVNSKVMQQAACDAIIANISACDEVWVVSEGAGQNLKSLGYTGDYRIMRNGVDFEKTYISNEVRSKIRAQHNVPEDVPLFLFVGRMRWYKGLKLVIDALSGLKNTGTAFRMIFIGNGLDLEEIKNYAEEENVADSCLFLDAISDRELLKQYYGASDLFMFLSDFDTNGIVVREAAACGLASMLLKGSAASEGVTDGVDGVLVENNIASIAIRLYQCAMNVSGMRELGGRARDNLYLSWNDCVAMAEDRYKQIIDNYKSGKMELKTSATDVVLEAAATVNDRFQKAYTSLLEYLPKRFKIDIDSIQKDIERYL